MIHTEIIKVERGDTCGQKMLGKERLTLTKETLKRNDEYEEKSYYTCTAQPPTTSRGKQTGRERGGAGRSKVPSRGTTLLGQRRVCAMEVVTFLLLCVGTVTVAGESHVQNNHT